MSVGSGARALGASKKKKDKKKKSAAKMKVKVAGTPGQVKRAFLSLRPGQNENVFGDA